MDIAYRGIGKRLCCTDCRATSLFAYNVFICIDVVNGSIALAGESFIITHERTTRLCQASENNGCDNKDKLGHHPYYNLFI